MHIALIGYATEGRASYAYYTARGHTVTICDAQADIHVPEGASAQLGDNYLDRLDTFDLIVRSAGIHPNIILSRYPALASKITTATNEFIKHCPTRNVIGVTGTKGKGTTSSLIAAMLEAANKHVFLGGNIGVSPLSFIDDVTEDSWVVLELSSFQLQDATVSPHIAVCLMVVPEHLNWHHDIEDYYKAKSQLFAHQATDDIAIYYGKSTTSAHIASASNGTHIAYYTDGGATVVDGQIYIDGRQLCKTADIALLGEHNWQNICAAVTAAWQVTHDIDAIRKIATTFTGLPHRLSQIGMVNGVAYYDDSFGTTPETAIVAIKAMRSPSVLILGGSSKGASFDELAATVATHDVRHVVLIGDTAQQIREALNTHGFTAVSDGGSTMQDIVTTARSYALHGDNVLLSTGCASFGLFKDYKDRGDQFIAAVRSLQQPSQ